MILVRKDLWSAEDFKMKKILKKIDLIFESFANFLVGIIIGLAIVYVVVEIVLPYMSGDYKMKRDYYEQHK